MTGEYLRETPVEAGNNTSEVHSPYYFGAVELLSDELAQRYPQETLKRDIDKGQKILDNIDRQGIENFEVFESEKFPGVKLPYARISLEDLLNEIAPDLETQTRDTDNPGNSTDRNSKSIYVISSGFAYPPAGHPFTPWDITYDRVIGLIPEAITAKKNGQALPDVYVLGSPNSLWGRVTPEWVSALKESGFDAYGKLCAELVEPKIREGIHESEMPRVVLQGMSLGSAVMQETRKNLPPDLLERTQLLLDNPVLSHHKLQVPVGFLAESAFRMALDARLKKSMSHEPDFYLKSEEALRKRGIMPVNDKNDTDLKKKAALADVRNLMKAAEIGGDPKTYIRLGLYDPVSFSIRTFKDRLDAYKRYDTHGLAATDNIYPINTSHFINRYRVQKWGRIIHQLPSSVSQVAA